MFKSTYTKGAYCIKRIFQARKTFETKQMLIRFFDLKKGLFPLFSSVLRHYDRPLCHYDRANV